MGKGKIARYEQFLFFPTVFSTRLKNFLPFSSSLKLSSANSFSLDQFKICRLGKDLHPALDVENTRMNRKKYRKD